MTSRRGLARGEVQSITRQFWIILTFSSCSGTGQDARQAPTALSSDMPAQERQELAASFLGHDLGALERLLRDSVIVQPPEIHGFRCIGDAPLVQVDVHLSPRFIQENLT